MVLWVDKYRPNTLDKLDLHPRVSQLMKQMVTFPRLNHPHHYLQPEAFIVARKSRESEH